MPKFYTTAGDDGFTGLLGEGRVAKYSPRLEAVGEIDEATAALGFARSLCKSERSTALLLQAQRDLYGLMAEVSATPVNAEKFRTIDTGRVTWVEEQTDVLAELVTIPEEFIIPGDSTAGAAIDLARTIVRKAERRVTLLLHEAEIENVDLMRYLNRLSSLCFVLELFENQAGGKSTPTLAKG
jgi:cob(I)alamin adenosyltransferase